MLPYTLETYLGIVARMNQELWLLALLALLCATLVAILALRPAGGPVARLIPLLLAAGWAATAWLFFGERLLPFFFGAAWLQWLYLGQAALLVLVALIPGAGSRAPLLPAALGMLAMVVAVIGLPMVDLALGTGWPAARVVGLAPEPTVLLTCGWLLTRRVGWLHALLAVPLLAAAAMAGYGALALGWWPDWLIPLAAVLALALPPWLARPRS